MEHFEKEALYTAKNPPSIWFRYVDDTMTKLHEYDIESFSSHLNSIDEHIKFTSEQEDDGKIPFLDTCVHVNDDGSTKVTVYRKPTHTDQYLNFNSNHHLDHGSQDIIPPRREIASEKHDNKLEIEHCNTAIRANGYPEWMFTIPKKKDKTPSDKSSNKNQKINDGMPYIRGTSEALHRTFKKYGISMYHRPYNSIRQQFTHVKDKTDKLKKCGVVYYKKCEQCKNDYIGETGRSLVIRLKEHVARSNSAIHEHCSHTGNKIDRNNTKILDSEDSHIKRRVNGAIHIKQRRPSLNRDGGLELPPVYNSLLGSRGHPTSRDSFN
ncbi:uncharacterized protein LOC127869610 [Dreissena polymorpha]|uniref:uncharacterized protein LOC127869610 n=1 Tax=Dreissena polymorpha TaxID=45954 RepID=UPI0022646184|nr:uncharacterized protein LOC127869610 [Dreissena polymorpha]